MYALMEGLSYSVYDGLCSLSIAYMYLEPEINVREFSHLLGTAIIAESAIIVRKNCVEQKFSVHTTITTIMERKLFFVSYYMYL